MSGTVGIASNGGVALNSSTPPAIIGNLYLGNTANTNGSASPVSGQVSGAILTNQDSFLGTGSAQTPPGFWGGGTVTATGAVADALNAAKFFNNLAPDQVLGSITSTTTLTATHAGYYVCDVTGNIALGNTNNLTLVGLPGTQFVLNVSGNITLNGGNNFSGGEIRLGGDLTPNDVVINVVSTSSGDNVVTSGGSSPDPSHPGNTLPNAQINGILLDVAGGVGMAPGLVKGEIIGGGNEIRLVSGSQVVPEPLSTPAVAAICLISLFAARKRRVLLA